MKRIKFSFFTMLAIILFATTLCGQEKKNSFQLTGIITHYINNEKYQLNGAVPGYYEFSVDPGFEILYLRSLSNTISFGTGFNYQKGRVASYLSGLRRFHFNEVSLPLLLQTTHTFKAKNKLFISPGTYIGVVSNIVAESPDKNGNWQIYTDFWYPIEKNSDDIFFVDLYFDVGYGRLLTNNSEISIAPYIKYRLNTTWLNLHEKRFIFGIKLSYSIKF